MGEEALTRTARYFERPTPTQVELARVGAYDPVQKEVPFRKTVLQVRYPSFVRGRCGHIPAAHAGGELKNPCGAKKCPCRGCEAEYDYRGQRGAGVTVRRMKLNPDGTLGKLPEDSPPAAPGR